MAAGHCPSVSFVPPSTHSEDVIDTQFFDAKDEAEQEYREQEAFECWLPKLSEADVKLFDGLC